MSVKRFGRAWLLGCLVLTLLAGQPGVGSAQGVPGTPGATGRQGTPGTTGTPTTTSGQVTPAADPGLPGLRPVTREEYTFGDTAFSPPGFPAPIELTASVHHPTSLAGGRLPLLVFLHGRHSTCADGALALLKWPCAPTERVIPSYRGYDYIGQVLASHGYIVVSISANGINAADDFAGDLGMLARAQLVQRHLDIWRAFNTTGSPPFGTKFVGKVDLNNVGTMGHSRGGEGVVRHVLLNRQLGSPYGIKAVLPLAPTDFNRHVANHVPLMVVLPYCDGDVSDLQGVHFFDDARYNVDGDRAPKHTVLVMGANHNFYNTVWTPILPIIFPPGAVDDWVAFTPGGATDSHCGTVAGNGRLTAEQQRQSGRAYMAAFLRTYVGNEPGFGPLLAGDVPPASAMTDQIHVSIHAPDAPRARRDVNRLLVSTNLTRNTLGGAVEQSALTPYFLCGGSVPQPARCIPEAGDPQQPHTTPSFLAPRRGLSQLKSGWDSMLAVYTNELPLGARDVSDFGVIQFRASVNFSDPRNPVGVPQDLSVVLADGSRRTAAVRVGAHSRALFYPPGALNAVPKVLLNGVRLPLSAFTGVNLRDVRSVQLRFDQKPTGALLISDLAFAEASGR